MERIKLNATARNQLATLKRRTGIEHNNAICRHALCISLANPTITPEETLAFSGGIEIDWRTFTGAQEAMYYNILVVRIMSEGRSVTDETIKQTLILHIHRGLSYLVSRRDDDLLLELARSITEVKSPFTT